MCKPKQKSISLQLRYLSFQHIWHGLAAQTKIEKERDILI